MSAMNPQTPITPAPTGPAAATSQVTAEEVELNNIQNGRPKENVTLEEDIMQCARIGALEHIQTMFQSGKYSPKWKDAEGITPLHWAAINNQYAVCKYLLEQGADVNAAGGDANATAVMWAAQRCHLYIVNLLLQNGADPLLMDGQGFNVLHLATIDGNALLLILLLQHDIPVDTADSQGHTCLMWAGYKGWPACVDLLLRWGASVNAKDSSGFTPLHWALVKGSRPCLEKIIEFGADRFAKTNDGKTPAMWADEIGSTVPYRRALADHGYGPDGNPKVLPLGLATILRDRSKMSKFYFLYPFFILFVLLYIAANFSIYIALPLVFVVGFGLQWIAQRMANEGPMDYRTIHKTPYLAGVFAGTLFWVGVCYITRILPNTLPIYTFSNAIFIIFFSLTTYFFFTAMFEDPGYVPKSASRHQQRAMVEELFSLWKFDEDSFCVQCMIRKPLRSKHCRRCGRCVAKHDHHCPWINNCVANNNIRHFYFYIFSMEIGIIVFTRLVMGYLDMLPASTGDESTCNIFNASICGIILRDPWAVALSLWTILQLTWVTMLVIVQSVQIAKNQTTYENMRRHSHDHDQSHPRPLLPLNRPNVNNAAATSLNDSAASSTAISASRGLNRHKPSCFGRFKSILGLDVFLATASDASSSKKLKNSNRANPFSRGIVVNCKDFWCDPAPVFKRRANGMGYLDGEVVDYTTMYEAPFKLSGSASGTSRRTRGGMMYERVGDADREQGDYDEALDGEGAGRA